jgi:hypothetical protein
VTPARLYEACGNLSRPALVLAALAGTSGPARAETSGQLWGNVVLDFPAGDGLLFELDIEPKVQYSGSETWRAFDLTPAAEFPLNRWIELVGEAGIGKTRQSNAVTSKELTPRAGIRFHFLNNLRTMLPGRHRLGRVGIANLSRVEWRNLWYSDGTPSSHESRFRNRIELTTGINHRDLSIDKTLYLVVDYEIFVPLSDDVPERFATKRRTRAGLGYRRDRKYRFEALYIRDGTRETEEGSFGASANIVDFRLKIFF